MNKETKSAIIAGVISSGVVSLIGGAGSMYVGYALVENRVKALEAKVIEQESRQTTADSRINQIAVDVSFIRGKLEGK